MSSILTNSSALTALQTLSSTNKSLETTQGRISTGLRIGEASDNASYWSIATSMKSDNKANAAVQDALGLGASKLDTAYTGITDIKTQVESIKEKLVTAANASLEDQKKISTEVNSILEQVKSSAANANFAGSNLLSGDIAADANSLSVVASYNRVGDKVNLNTVDVKSNNVQVLGKVDADTGVIDTASGTLKDLYTSFFSVADNATAVISADDIKGHLETVEKALSSLATGAAELGAAKSRIDTQKSFTSKLSDSIEKGVSALVDADMNKESARLSALQVQQQLGVQALSIANSSNQNIMSLFR